MSYLALAGRQTYTRMIAIPVPCQEHRKYVNFFS